MIVTQEEAQGKLLCPIRSLQMHNTYTGSAVSAFDKNCSGAKCMWWKWILTTKYVSELSNMHSGQFVIIPENEQKGTCGIIDGV